MRTVRAAAPIRICDNGGWTDTWVAQHGKVFNIAVTPVVDVRVDLFERGSRDARVVVNAENYGTRHVLSPHADRWGPHPLLEAAVRALPVPSDGDIEITIHSEAPAGASTGTSASVVVALLGALHRMAGDERTPFEIAYEAHAVETKVLGGESGIQDQLCAAFGGITFIEIEHYPDAVVTRVDLSSDLKRQLESRLSLVYLGRPHRSSEIHRMVLRDLQRTGADDPRLELLRVAAIDARDAVLAGDFAALGRAMRRNTDTQALLHAALVSSDAKRIIEIAAAHRALGWKVNGAGGDGGSITLLGDGDADRQREMLHAIETEMPRCRRIPVTLSDQGLRVWTEETVEE